MTNPSVPLGRVLVGCSGWNYRHWRGGVFYPTGLPVRSWLSAYAGRFDTVEVNATFYRLPLRRSVSTWASETPDDFVFTVKVSRFLTHLKRLRDVDEHLPLLLDRLEPLAEAGKLGPLLWQLPASFERDVERLAVALASFPRSLRHAIELRSESWYTPEVLELLRAHRVALVVADRPDLNHFQSHAATGDFRFVRLHHGSRGRNGNYAPSELRGWADRVRAWSADGDVYVYFNNDWEGYAPANASRLLELLSG